MRTSITLLLAGSFLAFLPNALHAETPTVKVTGIQLVGPGYGDDAFKGGIRAFHQQKGTALALLVTTESGAVLAIDDEKSKLRAITDAKGNDLTSKLEFVFGGFPKKSDDGKAAMIELKSEQLPPAGTGPITIKGTLAVSFGTKMETMKSGEIKPVKDAPAKVGDFDFVVSSTGKPDFGDAAFSVNLRIKKRIDEVTAFRFRDKDGTEIESKNTMTSSGGFNQFITVEKTFDLKNKPDSFVLELDVWTDAKTIDLPFEVTLPGGLNAE